MDKKQWQELYQKFDKIHSDFLTDYHYYKHGKNKKIRENASQKVYQAIDIVVQHIREYSELYELLFDENTTEFGKSIAYGEFKEARYFGRDMSKFLEKIKKKD